MTEAIAPRLRRERSGDGPLIERVVSAAFGRRDEAELVRALAGSSHRLISLVAEDAGTILGHVLFTRVRIAGLRGHVPAAGLAPLAVHPSRHRQGIGSALVVAGLAACREQAEAIVFVLGDPAYYPRFGFRPAGPLGFHYRDLSLDSAFQVVELAAGALPSGGGWVEYSPEFERL